MGDYESTARRHGKKWFVGSVYDELGGTLDIKLEFLEVGKNHKFTYYEDTKETHYKSNPEAYQVRQGIVKNGDLVKVIIAPGSGHCMRLRPE